MKNLLLIILCISACSTTLLGNNQHAEDLIDRLADAYAQNNHLILEMANHTEAKTVNALTKNYSNQLSTLETLFDYKIEKELFYQKQDFITEKTLFQKHILDLYASEYSRPFLTKNSSLPVKERSQLEFLVCKYIHSINNLNENQTNLSTLRSITSKELYHQLVLKNSNIRPKNSLKIEKINIMRNSENTSHIGHILCTTIENKPLLIKLRFTSLRNGVIITAHSQTQAAKIIDILTHTI